MIEALPLLYGFCAGSIFCLFFCLRYILDARTVGVDFLMEQIENHKEAMTEREKGFAEVTKKASEANLSLGVAVQEFEKRLKDMEGKLNMMHQRLK